MESQSAVIIPSAIQRLRCFMAAEGRHNVKPWASVDETLDAFYRLLSRNANDDRFWRGIRGLLGDISSDLKQRTRTNGRTLDNEVLNAETYDDLLAEIRGAVQGNSGRRGAFISCMSRLSAPAVSLLFLLGGAATLGCSEDSQNGTDTGTDPNPDNGDGTDSDSDIADGTDSDSDEIESDSMDSSDNGETDFSAMSLAQIVQTVTQDEDATTNIVSCIESLGDSWKTGLEELFQSEDSEDIARQLDCLMRTGFCDNPDTAGEYSLDTLLNNCAVAVYLGVHFE